MRIRTETLLLALVATAANCLPTSAEEDIVVTATRAPTLVDRLPTRIEIIGRADIEQRGLTSLTEALGSPAVQAGGSGQQASLFLRGTNSKHALALFDGVRLNDASTPNGQYDFGLDSLGGFDRLEVLRGPASSIYGSDAIGGVVNLLPRRGGESPFEPFLELEAGSFEAVRALLGAVGTVESLAYGVSAETLHTEGYDLIPERMATFADDPDGADMSTATLSVRNENGALGLDFLARWRAATTEYDTFSGGAVFDLRADDPDLETESSQGLWRVGVDHSFAPETRLRIDGGQVASDRTDLDGGFQTSAAQSTRTFVNLAANAAFGTVTLHAGGIFEREEIETLPQFADPLSIAEDHRGAYVIAQGNASDRFVFTGSLRVDDYESFGAQMTYNVGAVAFLSSLRVFAAYGTAFKAPSLSERYEVSFFNLGNPDLVPEQSSSWEVGADWQASDALRFELSYYETKIEDLIEYRFAQLRNVNVGEAEISGAEVRVEFAPADWAALRFDYAWTDAINGDTGARLARRPEHAWSLGGDIALGSRLSASATWSYVGERIDVIYNDNGAFVSADGNAPAFDVVDLALRYTLDQRAELFARIENVGDEVYEQPNAFAGPPRSFHVGLRAHY